MEKGNPTNKSVELRQKFEGQKTEDGQPAGEKQAAKPETPKESPAPAPAKEEAAPAAKAETDAPADDGFDLDLPS
jgi:hypothetical protein